MLINSNINFGLTFLILFVSALPLLRGGEVDSQYLLYSAVVLSSSSFVLISGTIEQMKNVLEWRRAIFFYVIWIGYQFVQILPFPVVNLSSFTIESWSILSVSAHSTLLEIVKNLSYLYMFLLTLYSIKTKEQAILLIKTIYFCSLVIAVYSLLNYFSNGSLSIFEPIPPWTKGWEHITKGTFSYQNHYASYLILTIPLGLFLMRVGFGSKYDISTTVLNRFKVSPLMRRIFYSCSTAIMVAALVLTSSRGALIAAFASLVVLVFTHFWVIRKWLRMPKNILKLGITSIMILVTIFVSGGNLMERFSQQGFSPNGRVLLVETALKVIANNPITGSGAGTYSLVQQHYKAFELGVTDMSQRAHNEYLELLSEQGVIGFTLLTIVSVLLYVQLMSNMKYELLKTHNFLNLSSVVFFSVTSIMVHSFVDFVFHLPNLSALFFILIASSLRYSKLISSEILEKQKS